jgi:hypothetical protein
MNAVTLTPFSLQLLCMYRKNVAPFNPKEANMGNILWVNGLVEETLQIRLFETIPLDPYYLPAEVEQTF